MFGSKVRAWCSIPRHDDVPAIALTPSSYQTLREPMWNIASANARTASRPTHSPRRCDAGRASGASDGGEKVENGIDCTAATREVVSRDGNPAGTGNSVGQSLRVAGELVVGTGDHQ